MSKANAKNVNQLSLFNMIQQDNKFPENGKPGSLNFSQEHASVLSRTFSNSGLDVVKFASRMTERIHRGISGDPIITPDKIRSWTSSAKIQYAPKAWELPAFCEVAGSEKPNDYQYEPIEFLVRKVHRFMQPGPEALRAEIQKKDEEIKALEAEREEMLLYLKISNKK